MFPLRMFFDFFIPNTCYTCGKILEKDEKYLCKKCIQSIEISDIETCLNHQLVLENKYFHHLFYFATYKDVLKDAIHLFKYDNRPELAEILAYFLFYRLNEIQLLLYEYDFILFVPLHHVKKRERGFNQSEELAKQLSLLSGIPVLKNGIVRTHNSISQTKISFESRLKNVNNHFRGGKNAHEIRNKNIILIDDVVTTGSTLNEVAKALIPFGPANIDCLTLATARK
ncbi:MAG TPA: ComF family protein [Firmicutes bacterium]|nr:ComF family protein [Bacillota bacterium]